MAVIARIHGINGKYVIQFQATLCGNCLPRSASPASAAAVFSTDANEKPLHKLISAVHIPEAVTSGSYTFENVTTDSAIEVIFAQTVGISEMTADKIKIYPNPANDLLYFSSETPFDMINLQGKVLLKSEKAVNYLNVSGLPAGIYFVKVCGEIVKIVKQ